MALHFHTLTVNEIRRETFDCVSLAFDIPDNLKNDFKFKQGQNVTLKKNINNEEIRRSYSICSSPLENELRVAIKKVFNGSFSTFANTKLAKGDEIEVMPPSGNFYTDLSALNKKTYLAFAAGSGITPIISIIKMTLAIEKESAFILVFGNRNHTSIMFKKELEALKDKYLERFSLIHILSRERTEADINYGRINEEKCFQLARLINLKSVNEFFICGPEEMLFSIKDFLQKKGVGEKEIHFELFSTPTKKRTTIYRPVILNENADSGNITVKLDGRSFDFKLDFNSNNILDAALAQGADLPFACKGGVCTTCKAKLIEGEIEMEVNYGLEADEIKAGYILTCQSHPRTKNVIIDFDIK